jgi:Cu(I)/Ag(I) efflux system membrane fusion protein
MNSLARVVVIVVTLLVGVGLGAVLFGGGSDGPSHAAHDVVYTCSMHPQIRQPEPGDCPICGMDLVLAGGATQARTDRVVLSDRARALARLQTTAVGRQGEVAAQVRLSGVLEPDETTRRNVTTWVDGRIDRLHVAATGEQVHAGQVVATLYSPEVYAAHQDLLAARDQVASLQGAAGSARGAAEAALEAARQRLRLLGVPAWELERMEGASAPTRSVSVRTPFGGTVIERVATEGAFVGTGATLYRLADLEQLWALLDAYERDLPQLAEGQPVQLEVEGLAEPLAGTVDFVDPTLDPARRTARVRVEVHNPDGRLRPGMFVEAVVAASPDGGAPLVVPASAALFTGKRSLVYVEHDDGQQLSYEPRTVRLGPRLGEVYPVLAGLSEGERVVTRGAFALDADLQIQGGPSMMSSPDDRSPDAPLVGLDAEERARLAPVMSAYLEVQRALAEDDHPATVVAATTLADATAAVQLVGEAGQAWSALSASMEQEARQIAGSADLAAARVDFEPLSADVQRLLRTFGNPLDEPVQVAFCPMAADNQGASWVQQGEQVDNAYFGAAMRRCGEVEQSVAPGAYLPEGRR